MSEMFKNLVKFYEFCRLRICQRICLLQSRRKTRQSSEAVFDVGKNVTLTVEANVDADQLKLLVRSAQPVDVSVQDAAAMGLKIFVSNEDAVKSISTRLNEILKDTPQRALGPVHLVLSHPELPGEVEIALKSSYPLNPQIKGAIKHIDGVLEVMEF